MTAARYAPRFEPELESAMLKSIKLHVGFAAGRVFTLGEEARGRQRPRAASSHSLLSDSRE
jgi:hypothetical protein